ncbi:MAG: transposase [Burkholderiales bacterium]
MPRTARAVVAGIALHVIQRGNNRGQCFFRESDRTVYLNYLRRFAPRCGCLVHAYCLMSNHVHLLVTPQTADACGLLMKRLGQHYVQYVNRVHGRTGTLWEGRFRSCLAASERYVLACYRYIELNPVRAGIVSRAHDYRWSSHRVNARGEADGLLAPHPAYLALADGDVPRRLQYRGLFDGALDPLLVDEIRSATRNGCVLGAARSPRGRPQRK